MKWQLLKKNILKHFAKSNRVEDKTHWVNGVIKIYVIKKQLI